MKTDLKDKSPKKGILGVFKKKSDSKKIVKLAKEKKVEHFLFYTNVSNVPLILETGIKLLKEKGLKKDQEYTVWTYLENDNSIGLEMDNSSRSHFWKWSNDAKIDINEIATIGINYEKLFDLCKKDWAQDTVSNLIFVYEAIPVDCIEWIMIKKRSEIELIETYINNNDLNIDVFFGEKGNIEKIDKKYKK